MKFPTWATWYKKPEFVDVKQYANALNEKASSSTPSSPRSSGETTRSKKNDIPKRLSLDRIMKNKTCSPMSLYDFYMYLKYIELSAENLEFYVWFKNYEQGRLTAFPDIPRALTPVSGSEASFSKEGSELEEGKLDGNMPEPGNNLELNESELYARIASFVTPGSGCGGACPLPQKRSNVSPLYKEPLSPASTDETTGEAPNDFTRENAEVATAQHAELETIKDLFLMIGSPKELNLPAPMRKQVIDAINSGSIDPENLRMVADHCFLLLKSCSHRNFIRLGVSNGTFETLCVATTLGIILTVMGFVSMILLAFVSPGFRQASRWRGIGIWPMWAVGVGLILSGLRGSCFFLLLFSRRQPLPWERFDEQQPHNANKPKPAIIRLLSKLMIFDRKMKVKDDDLRRLQHLVITQSLLGGAAFATVFTALFLCIPMWKPL